MLAKGYILGQDAIAKAREIDDQNRITVTAEQYVGIAKEKITQLDQQYKISEKVSQLAADVSEKAKEVDNQWHISETVSNAAKNIADTVEVGIGAIQNRAKESPVVQNTVTKLTQLGTDVQNFIQPSAEALKANIDDIKEQTFQQVEANQRDRTDQPYAPVPTNTSENQQQQQQEHTVDPNQDYTLGEEHPHDENAPLIPH